MHGVFQMGEVNTRNVGGPLSPLPARKGLELYSCLLGLYKVGEGPS